MTLSSQEPPHVTSLAHPEAFMRMTPPFASSNASGALFLRKKGGIFHKHKTYIPTNLPHICVVSCLS
jgi:hypothetical protein